MNAVLLLGSGEPPPAQPDATPGTARVAILRHESSSIEVSVEAPRSGYLVLSEIYYPGWRARVDGRPAPVERADFCLRAVAVPAGSRRVELWLDDSSFRLGLWIAAATVVVIVAMAAMQFASMRRRIEPDGA